MARSSVPWEEIKCEYVTTEKSMSQLAQEYGIDKAAVSRRATIDGWKEQRQQFQTEVNEAAHTRIKEQAIDTRVRLYDATREAAENIIAQMLEASKNTKAIHLHTVQREESTFDFESKSKTTSKWLEDKALERVDGRNAADMARAIKELATIARVLDGIVEAADHAKLELDRERLELDKRKAGMGDDVESESGIALMPGIDESLLDNALPDPDQQEGLNS